MKSINRFAAILLAVIMTLALSVPAFAADAPTYSITVSNTSDYVSIEGNTYYAYKLFDVVYNETKTAYAYTIDSVNNPFYLDDDAKDVIETYFTLTATAEDPTIFTVVPKGDDELTEADARALANALEAYLPDDADAEATADAESVVIGLETAGYYLVAGEVSAVHAGQTGTAPKVTSAIAITNADPEAAINIKADAPDIDKFIIGADDHPFGTANGFSDLGKGTSVNVGDIVPFLIVSKIPVTTGYSKYMMAIHDVMTSGLTLLNDTDHPITVKIGDDTLTAADYTLDADTDSFDLTIADVLVTVNTAAEGEDPVMERKYADNDPIVVTCYAQLNSSALSTDVEKNVVNLEYSSNPYDEDETKTTPDHTVYVYDFEIDIDKFTGTDTKLEGAKFVLYRLNASSAKEYAKIDDTTKAVTWYALDTANEETLEQAIAASEVTEVVTDTNGYASFAGLDSGVYYLTETEAPEGYNKLTADVTVTITATYNTDHSGLLASSSASKDGDNGQYKQTQSIENKTGTVLPETGGMGTACIIAVSSVIFVSVMLVLVAKKRLYNEG
ncbi:MAG: pilin N-terminal domain-containing protein [Lachnospiraceae bacterium]|nr:pilin N-terminal domain-containing protein [Lachnospiraceae bacterium]